MDGAGDGRFVVGIRAMTVDAGSVTLTAGVGHRVRLPARGRAARDRAQVRRSVRRPGPRRAVRHVDAPGTPGPTPSATDGRRPRPRRPRSGPARRARRGPRSARPGGARSARRPARRRPASAPPTGGRRRPSARPPPRWAHGSRPGRRGPPATRCSSARCSAVNVRRWRPRAPALAAQHALVGQRAPGRGRGRRAGSRGVRRRARGSTSPRASSPATVRASPSTGSPSRRSMASRLSGVHAAPTRTRPETRSGRRSARRTATPPAQLWATTVAGPPPWAVSRSAA